MSSIRNTYQESHHAKTHTKHYQVLGTTVAGKKTTVLKAYLYGNHLPEEAEK